MQTLKELCLVLHFSLTVIPQVYSQDVICKDADIVILSYMLIK